MNLPVTALALCSLLAAYIAPVRADRGRTVYFIGASETAGYGLRSGTPAYPGIISARCQVRAEVRARSGQPVVMRSEPTWHARAIVLLISQFDAEIPLTDADMERWLYAYARRAPTLIVEAPYIDKTGIDAPTLAAQQHAFYARVERVALRWGVSHILLHIPQPVAAFLQRDGIHPDARGQRLIAEEITPWFQTHLLCPNE